LTAFERELLELCSMAGEATTTLDEELLESSPGRPVVEITLRKCRAFRLDPKREASLSPDTCSSSDESGRPLV
jgi:hypothetical protein